MASDVSLVIFDPHAGCVVRERWLGMGGTADRARAVLRRAAERSELGYECWTNVSPTEVIAIAEEHYESGGTPAEMAGYARAFPSPRYCWLIERNG
jgi:hypothetical protein